MISKKKSSKRLRSLVKRKSEISLYHDLALCVYWLRDGRLSLFFALGSLTNVLPCLDRFHFSRVVDPLAPQLTFIIKKKSNAFCYCSSAPIDTF